MQRSKSLTLVTQIFNKLSSRSFISKTCSTHIACLPLYICLNCFHTKRVTLCEQCFKEHQCDKKLKGEISKWVSQQQQKIGKYVSGVFKDFDNSRKVLLSGKIRIGEQQRSIGEVNNQIITGVTKKLEKAQKNIQQNCMKPVLEGPLKSTLQAYASSIKIKLNGLGGNLSQIPPFLDYCESSSKQVQLQIENESKQALAKSSIFYQESVKQVLSEVLIQFFGQDKTNNLHSKHEDVNEKIKNSKIQSLLKQKDSQKLLVEDLDEKITKIQQELQRETQRGAELVRINKHIIDQSQEQQKVNLKKQSQLEEKVKNLSKAAGESGQKDNYIKKLESKVKVYENKLAQYARQTVSQHQKPQSRFNMEEMANRLTELGQQNQSLIIECNGKDKKIAQLVVEINKMKIRKNEERMQHSSGKKMNFP